MEAFPPYGQKKLQTEVTQRRAELSHEEGDSSQHGSGSPSLPCQDYPRLFRCERQQIPHLCFRGEVVMNWGFATLELKESLLLYTVSYSFYIKRFSVTTQPEERVLCLNWHNWSFRYRTSHPAFLECVCNLSSLPLSFRAASAMQSTLNVKVNKALVAQPCPPLLRPHGP